MIERIYEFDKREYHNSTFNNSSFHSFCISDTILGSKKLFLYSINDKSDW